MFIPPVGAMTILVQKPQKPNVQKLVKNNQISDGAAREGR
jgi:hypothetical protein